MDAVLLPDGLFVSMTEGTTLSHVTVIAGKGRDRKIDMVDVLVDIYGGHESEWTKKKGFAYLDYMGESWKAELHWYEEPTVGRVEVKVKTKNGEWRIDG